MKYSIYRRLIKLLKSKSYERKKETNLWTSVSNWSRPPRPFTWITAVAYSRVCSPHNCWEDSKTAQITPLLCADSLSGSDLSSLPLFLLLHLWPAPLFTPLQSQRPPCCQPGTHFTGFSRGSLPSFRSSFNYCSIKETFSNSMYFNKMATPYPNSQSFSIFLILLYFLPSTYHLLSCVFVYCRFPPTRIWATWGQGISVFIVTT